MYIYIYMSVNWIITVSCSGLLPIHCQAITWTTADRLSMESVETYASVNLNQNANIYFKIVHLKILIFAKHHLFNYDVNVFVLHNSRDISKCSVNLAIRLLFSSWVGVTKPISLFHYFPTSLFDSPKHWLPITLIRQVLSQLCCINTIYGSDL